MKNLLFVTRVFIWYIYRITEYWTGCHFSFIFIRMSRHGVPVRERVCVTCDNPSPGPIRHLYYRWRLHGPFFPLLERLKTAENARLFANGRVPVCNSCANYLQRQWNDYERKSISLPLEKRTYRLLSGKKIYLNQVSNLNWSMPNNRTQQKSD